MTINLDQCDKYYRWYLPVQIHHSKDNYMLSFIKGQNKKVVNMRTTWLLQKVFDKVCINVIGGKSIFGTLMHINHFINKRPYILEKVVPVKYTYCATPKLKSMS